VSASPLRRLVRHAESFGVEEVFATAEEEGFSAEDLARLAMALRRIDRHRAKAEKAANVSRRIAPVWHLTPRQRDRLFGRLAEQGASDRFMRDALDVSQPTVRTLRAAGEARLVVEAPTPAREPALQSLAR
jgi:hypothetical protein